MNRDRRRTQTGRRDQETTFRRGETSKTRPGPAPGNLAH